MKLNISGDFLIFLKNEPNSGAKFDNVLIKNAENYKIFYWLIFRIYFDHLLINFRAIKIKFKKSRFFYSFFLNIFKNFKLFLKFGLDHFVENLILYILKNNWKKIIWQSVRTKVFNFLAHFFKKSKNLPKYWVSWVETMLEWKKIKF